MNAPVSSTKYETLAIIGQGGMATVALGRMHGAAGFSRLVAIKRAHVHLRDEAASIQHEAAIVARLHHPNIVRVLDVVEEGAELVLLLDYVEGGSLSDLVQRVADVGLEARTRTRAFVRILVDVAAGLDAAHRVIDDEGRKLGLVHRDVSPSNVLVGTDGIARLTDFGIAKALEAAHDRTATGRLKGKIAYMAPEYVESHRADAYSDQFSLGVVAWEALAGTRLFRGPTEIETLKRVAAARIPSLSEARPELAPLEPVILRALARLPSDRHASAQDFGAALEAAARKAGLLATHAEVARLVETLLGDEIERRRAAARSAGRPSASTDVPAAARDLIPTGSLGAPPRDERSGTETDPTVVSMPDGRPIRRSLIGAAIAFAALLAVIVGVVRLRGADEPPGPSAGSSSADVPPTEAVPPANEPVSESASEPGATEPSAPEPAATAPAPGPRRRPRKPRPPATSSSLVPNKAPPNPYLR